MVAGSAAVRQKAKLADLAVSKAERRLVGLAGDRDIVANSTNKVAVLVWKSPCNPVQRAHLELFQRARQLVERTARMPVAAAYLAPEAEAPECPCLPFAIRTVLCRLACEESDFIETCAWGWDISRTSERIIQQLTAKLSWSGGLRWEFQPWCLITGLHATDDRAYQDMPVVCMGPAVQSPAPCTVTDLEARIRRVRRRSYEHHPTVLLPTRHKTELPETLEEQEQRLQQLLISSDWEQLSESGLVSPNVLEPLRRAVVDPAETDFQLPGLDETDDDQSALEQLDTKTNARPDQGFSQSQDAFKKGRLHFTTGEAAKASQSSGRKVIAHLCNDQGNGGRGYFQAIKKTWGSVPSRQYFEWHRDRKLESVENRFRLGAAQFVQVSPLVEVANLIVLQGSRSGSKGGPLRLEALEDAVEALASHAAMQGASVHMQASGGAAMDKLVKLLREAAQKHHIDIFVYK